MTTHIDKHNALSPSEPPAKHSQSRASTSLHPFARYFRKHNHYPQIRVHSGVQRLTIEFAPGYVRIATSHPFAGEIYVTRSAFFVLLQRSIPLARRWAKHPDFDVPQAQLHLYRAEEAHSQALRQEKKNRSIQTPDPERQRRRWEKAKARANRQF